MEIVNILLSSHTRSYVRMCNLSVKLKLQNWNQEALDKGLENDFNVK